MTQLCSELSLFTAAATWAARVVGAVPNAAWGGPGLGDWNMRALVGHTSRALLTVEQYLTTSASQECVTSAAQYYERVARLPGADPEAVKQRGIEAGQALGETPSTEFAKIVERVAHRLEGENDRLISTIAGGILLSNYLPTRTFELIVHGLDITRAAGLDVAPPGSCLNRVLELGMELVLCSGRSTELIMAITGRTSLPEGFTILQ